jgi:hypothetical protein
MKQGISNVSATVMKWLRTVWLLMTVLGLGVVFGSGAYKTCRARSCKHRQQMGGGMAGWSQALTPILHEPLPFPLPAQVRAGGRGQGARRGDGGVAHEPRRGGPPAGGSLEAHRAGERRVGAQGLCWLLDFA